MDSKPRLDDERTRRPVGSVPPTLEIVLGNELYFAKEGLPAGLQNRLF